MCLVSKGAIFFAVAGNIYISQEGHIQLFSLVKFGDL